MLTPVDSADDTMRTQVDPLPKGVATPAAVASPAVRAQPAAYAPASASGAQLVSTSLESRPDLRPLVRAMVDQAIEPLDRTVRDLRRRLEELERRPPPIPVVIAAPSPVAASPTSRAYPSLPSTPAPAHVLDLAAIERAVRLDPEMQALSGRRRRLRIVLGVAFFLFVVFGGLFLALAQSYTHAHP
jgi:hypothetical protein